MRQIFIGQNWILPCNCLPNFNGLKSTLPRSAPRRFWHYGRIPWKGFWNPSLLEDIIKILCRNMIFISGVSIKRPQVLAYFLFLLIELRGRRQPNLVTIGWPLLSFCLKNQRNNVGGSSSLKINAFHLYHPDYHTNKYRMLMLRYKGGAGEDNVMF